MQDDDVIVVVILGLLRAWLVRETCPATSGFHSAFPLFSFHVRRRAPCIRDELGSLMRLEHSYGAASTNTNAQSSEQGTPTRTIGQAIKRAAQPRLRHHIAP
jgi:hypothetical protein